MKVSLYVRPHCQETSLVLLRRTDMSGPFCCFCITWHSHTLHAAHLTQVFTQAPLWLFMAMQSVTLILSHCSQPAGLGSGWVQVGSPHLESLKWVLSDSYWSFYLHPDYMFQVTGLADKWCQLLVGSSAEAVDQGIHTCLFHGQLVTAWGPASPGDIPKGHPQKNSQRWEFCETKAERQDFLFSVLGVHTASRTTSVIFWAEGSGTLLSLEVHLRICTIFNPPARLSLSPNCEDWGSQPELTDQEGYLLSENKWLEI